MLRDTGSFNVSTGCNLLDKEQRTQSHFHKAWLLGPSKGKIDQGDNDLYYSHAVLVCFNTLLSFPSYMQGKHNWRRPSTFLTAYFLTR